jgi:PIF1-like helicase
MKDRLICKIQLPMTNEEATTLLADAIKLCDEKHDVEIPLRVDGTPYRIEDLAIDQKESLAHVLNAVRSYCYGDDVNDDKVLRVTLSGVAGSGKSTWINTLVTALRKMFRTSETVAVFAPTGSAAYNAGGETLHRGFKVPRKFDTMNISPSNQAYMLRRFGTMLVLIIDERSMMDAAMLGIIQHYMAECAHQGKNKNHPWGGIPIIILVGDDYQLPPILPGAFYAMNPTELPKTFKMSYAYFQIRLKGFAEFMKIGNNVIYLEGEKRVNEGQDMFKQLLKAVRCEDGNNEMTEEQAQTLLELDLYHKTFSTEQRQIIQDEATYIFANREPRDKHNSWKLKLANSSNTPVARIKSKTVKPGGRPVSNQTHFDVDRQPGRVLLCKGARVTLNGYNPDPRHGLFHGSLGIVQDIVYDIGKSPNVGDFPSYVLVEFYQYCGPELIPNLPRSVPIIPIDVRCDKGGCCIRTYMPLALAYGKTAHTFQGQSVGPVPAGRPENPIKKIVVDPGKREFEGKNVGLFYTLLSRATTIGDRNNKLSSAIYFDGQNFSRRRIENLTMKTNKEMYKMAILRKNWVRYLRANEVPKGQWTKDEMEDLFTWAQNTTFDANALTSIINFHNTTTKDGTD